MSSGRRGPATLLLLPLLLAACAPASNAAKPQNLVTTQPVRPSLAQAMRAGRDLGPVDPHTPMRLTLTLAPRDAAGLDALLTHGGRVDQAEYTARFAPTAQSLAAVRTALASASLQASYQPGDQLVAVDGEAAQVESFFGVGVHQFLAPDGERFHAPLQAARIPVSLRGLATSVVGLDDYTQRRVAAIRSTHGMSPQDVMGVYDIAGLRGAGIDGSGTTVVFPEIDRFQQSDLDAYAQQYGLPPFQVTVHQDPSWGQPQGVEGEANMDLEIVHAIAPAAKLVVYSSSPDNDSTQRMLQRMFADQAGAIVSSSIGVCESADAQALADQENAVAQAAAARGTSIFVASGDRGAYDCLPWGDADTLATDLDGGLPSITSVGGTTVFMGAGGGYFKETSWGEPVEQWGGGGGLSIFWKRPDWQSAPGVDNGYSNGMRQVPDVSADADGQSGWNVVSDGRQHKIGGTSAAAPLWAAITALVDQSLRKQGHQDIGFANPGLYWMAQNQASLPAPPFHDVVQGTNLYYPATPGWDYASGLGSPDVGALAEDWAKYMESQGR